MQKEVEDQLVKLLKENSATIGWGIGDIKGISATRCTHRISLEDDAKPVRQPQRRLNPVMQDVVKTEILKMLEHDMIYPIADSKWVSTVYMVPKKSRVTVETNEKGIEVPLGKPLDGVCE